MPLKDGISDFMLVNMHYKIGCLIADFTVVRLFARTLYSLTSVGMFSVGKDSCRWVSDNSEKTTVDP